MWKLRFRRKRLTVLIFVLITLAVGFLLTLQFGIEVDTVELGQPEITTERRKLVEALDNEINTVMVWREQKRRSTKRRTSFGLNPTTVFLTQKGSQELHSGGELHKTTQYSNTVQQLARSELQPEWQENQVKVFSEWQQNKKTACDGNVEIYPGHFVSLREVVFRKALVSSKNAGGEEMSNVMEQSEEDEYFTLNKGFFSLTCRELPAEYRLSDHKGHLNKWLDNTISQSITFAPPVSYTNDFTIIVKRYEYVNLYHSMTDFYNAFLVMTFFRKSPNGTKILFFDTHPKGSLDAVWNTLFKSAFRVSQLQAVTRFRHAVWSIPGYDSPMFDYTEPESIPLIEEFRQFFLKQYRVREKRDLDCKRGLRLVLIWRRNYVAHPRNPSGEIERKIWNEKQLLSVANKTGLFSLVIGIQLDRLAMRRQLSIISSADILVGMHGAGLTHAVFLPSYAGLIELVPQYSPELGHFEGIAQWRSLHYLRWHNQDGRNEMSEKRTRIPPAVFHRILSNMRQKLCG